MSLVEQIKADKRAAMLARNSAVSTLLGTLLGAIQTKESTFSPRRELADDEVVAQVKKMLDGVNETIGHLTGKPDREADLVKARSEIVVLSAYMPQQIDEAAIEEFLRQKMAEGVSGMGALMKALKDAHAGAYDGRLASAVAKRL